MKTVLCVIGTRPEAIKMAPVVRALGSSGRFRPVVCATGQHREMLDEALAMFSLSPDVDLDVMRPGQTLAGVSAAVLGGIDGVLADADPDSVLVQGDTTTTMAAALAAFWRGIPVGHVEAGLRTGDLRAPFPEEANRRIASIVTDLHFAPTPAARRNLLAEGVAADRVHVTGNTVIDALLWMAERVRDDRALADEMTARIPALARCGEGGRRLVLVTGHRRESFGRGFENICTALARIAERDDVEIVYPVHLNPNVRGPVHRRLGRHENIHLIEPVDYRRFVWLMTRAHLVLTDSGGVQEEAPALGRPVLVMREVTERAEAVDAGVVRLVGTDPDRIVAEVSRLIDDPEHHARMSRPTFCYGDGHAAERIVKLLEKMGGKEGWG
ncbi:MAG: UDP-N-acetylglucosamine 2-epimerase (non-hydrolyzing) [Alphaproteobacteria bacterium]|nr:MAG: UDP-N-acetylglucosamine 2-epimerase (non-hydrolyzing) [Alphaproteobacteria bacterium]